MKTIVWFRQDLRLSDNPALSAAAAAGAVVPVYILDDSTNCREIGDASKWWLHHSLGALRADLGALLLRRGDPGKIVNELVRDIGACAVYWNRVYEPSAIARDRAIKADLTDSGVEVRSFNAALLHEPWEIKTGAGGPFKVYSPFWRACLARGAAPPLARPQVELFLPESMGADLDGWGLLPRAPNWADGWRELWRPGEQGAHERLETFIESGLAGYAADRNRPDLANVSRLSAHLHFGEISPRQVWSRLMFETERNASSAKDTNKFLAEIGWREFSHHLLFHFPEITTSNWKPAFDNYPWAENSEGLKAWRGGMTGYPLVDAGMRELWQTGYMHNRVRMVVASFLVKHLRIHWRQGEAWFWDTLVDADLATNCASWQWVTGSGADAAPYFRVFNPVTQGEKFDPNGDYLRRWCPELSSLDTAYIHKPFAAPASVLKEAGVELGATYPRPVVEHAEARRAALAGYEMVKAASAA